MSASQPLKPLSLRRQDDGLMIDWNDGVRTFVTWRKLRGECPCASCLEEREKPADPFRVLKPTEVAAGLPQPIRMEPRGHYAYQITWNDEHDTGIYTLEILRQLSEPRSKS